MSFENLGLNEFLLKSLEENNISQPSEIQEKVIPLILNQKSNVLAISQTGTGKTLAFGLPILQQINPQDFVTQALVLVPTRELGQQVAKDLFLYSRYIVRIHTEGVFGGKKIEEQIKKLETPKHILVATPGRLLDLLKRKIVSLKALKFLVLDETDIMLNMGFLSDIESIIKATNSSARILLFTSTMPKTIRLISEQYLGRNYKEINIKPQELVNKNIQHFYIPYTYGYKFEFLKSYLLRNLNLRGIIFCRTQAAVKLLSQQLIGCEINALCLHGDMSQYERNKVMNAFKLKQASILVATDIAARGLDIAEIDFVIHYHLPDQQEQYVNRSGRTARAGKKGDSIVLLQEDEVFQKDELEQNLGIKFNPLIENLLIDKEPSIQKFVFKINIGLRHELNKKSLVEFISEETGIKTEFFKDVYISLAESKMSLFVKYKSQLINNLDNTKHFRQRIKIEVL